MEWNAVVKRVEITKDTVAKGNRKNRSESDTITGPISDQIGGAEQIGPSDEPSGTKVVSEVRVRRSRETLSGNPVSVSSRGLLSRSRSTFKKLIYLDNSIQESRGVAYTIKWPLT